MVLDRSVDERGNKSSFFPSTTGKFNPKNAVPEPPTNLKLDGAFDNFFLSWDNSISTNVKEYEIWKSPSVALQKNSGDITNDLLNTGVIYLNDNSPDNNIFDDFF